MLAVSATVQTVGINAVIVTYFYYFIRPAKSVTVVYCRLANKHINQALTVIWLIQWISSTEVIMDSGGLAKDVSLPDGKFTPGTIEN